MRKFVTYPAPICLSFASPFQVNPITDYYIIAGIVYQAPDLGSVVNSRLLTTVTHLQSAFEEARGFAKYHPSKSYWWDFESGSNSGSLAARQREEAEKKKAHSLRKKKRKAGKGAGEKKESKEERRTREEPSSMFQRRRVDFLLELMTNKFPPKVPATAATPAIAAEAKPEAAGAEAKAADSKDTVSVKSESAGVKREASKPAAQGGGAKKLRVV